MNTPAETIKTNRWNILLITSDEHNPKIMGCAGNPIVKTPAMDRLAKEGTLFTKAYCPYPACAPSRQSMITGLYPQEHGQIGNPYYFSEKNQTWANYFRQCGYTTACIGKMHTNNEWNDHGYDYRFGPLDYDAKIQSMSPSWRAHARYTDDYTTEVFKTIKPQLCREMFQAEVLETPDEHRDIVFLEEAKRYLREKKESPFFLHVSFTDPHWPWNMPEKYFNMYDPETVDWPDLIPDDLEDDWLAAKRYHEEGWDKIPENIIRLCRAKYYGSVSYVDFYVGQLLDILDEMGLAENTLVMYTSDHGDMAGEKGLWFKDLLFDASARIPMIARMPGVIPAGRKCDSLISLVDLFPTFAGLTDSEKDLPEGLSGQNLADVFCGQEGVRRYVFCTYHIDKKTLHPQTMMVRSARWKCIRYEQADSDSQYVLYDMDNDPDEVVNLARDIRYQNVLKEHLDAMDKFLSERTLTDIEPRVMLQIG